MLFAFFYPKHIPKVFSKTIDFVKILEMTKIAGGAGVVFFASLWRNAYENWYVINP